MTEQGTYDITTYFLLCKHQDRRFTIIRRMTTAGVRAVDMHETDLDGMF